MRIDQLYGPGGLDMAHPSFNILDQFVHADPDDPAKGVEVQRFDADGKLVEYRAVTPEEIVFFFAEVGDRTDDGELAAVAVLANKDIGTRLAASSDEVAAAMGDEYVQRADDLLALAALAEKPAA